LIAVHPVSAVARLEGLLNIVVARIHPFGFRGSILRADGWRQEKRHHENEITGWANRRAFSHGISPHRIELTLIPGCAPGLHPFSVPIEEFMGTSI
jgi:hypothetical protein